MHPTCLDFVKNHISSDEIVGRSILEVGSYNVNGSVRRHIEAAEPAEYIGVDIAAGPGVDRVCSVSDLVQTFGDGRFDVVVSTEMLEHVEDWRSAVHNLKAVVKPGGLLVLTTRSPGFAVHAFPYDHWRFTKTDMCEIFSDFGIEALVQDERTDPGIFVRARRPVVWKENDLSAMRLVSVGRRIRTVRITSLDTSLVMLTAAVHRRVPDSIWMGLRLVSNCVGYLSRDRRAGSGLRANLHKPYADGPTLTDARSDP